MLRPLHRPPAQPGYMRAAGSTIRVPRTSVAAEVEHVRTVLGRVQGLRSATAPAAAKGALDPSCARRFSYLPAAQNRACALHFVRAR